MTKNLFLLPVLTLTLSAAAQGADSPSRLPSSEQLAALLKHVPAADTNRDGVLSAEEAKAWISKRKSGKQQPAQASNMPAPACRDVSYGPHAQNVLDLWLPAGSRPTPLVVFIHGGGFVGGDKSQASPQAISACLASNVAFAAINYRFRQQAPIQDILRDAARAIQFLRLHASEYGIDTARIACYGGSAGAGTSLWLATRDDLADSGNADPVLRQSTRLRAAACINGQASYDLTTWDSLIGPFRTEWKSSPDEEVVFYHFKCRDDLRSEPGKSILAECDMLGWISRNDPPLYLACSMTDEEPASRSQYVHHPRHARAVKARCDAVGEACELVLGQPGGERQAIRFLLQHLL